MSSEEGKHYSAGFFSAHAKGARSSAEIMVPLVIDLVRPRRVIDVGCGTGDWLAVFRANGVEDVVGVDGAYVDKRLLKIPEERFIPADLAQPFRLEQTSDLVVSLEVAEHLPPSSAEPFVASLTYLAPVVLFSAAIPNQGGTNHINEQWPEYWANLFREKGYVVVDALRSKVWKEESMEWWYIQNALIFVAQDRLGEYPLLSKEYAPHGSRMLSVVHPRLHSQKVHEATLHHLLIERPRYVLTLKAKSILPDNIYRLVRTVYRRLRSARWPRRI
jgi:SAM-dependent methyltransferase